MRAFAAVDVDPRRTASSPIPVRRPLGGPTNNRQRYPAPRSLAHSSISDGGQQADISAGQRSVVSGSESDGRPDERRTGNVSRRPSTHELVKDTHSAKHRSLDILPPLPLHGRVPAPQPKHKPYYHLHSCCVTDSERYAGRINLLIL